MAVSSNKAETVSKDEILHSLSEKTGFTLRNCRTAYDALVEVFKEAMLDGRAIVFTKFGRLEPYKKQPRKFYRINKEEGIAKDDAGRPETYIFPECKNVKFHIAKSFKYKLNPGLYVGEDIEVDDCV